MKNSIPTRSGWLNRLALFIGLILLIFTAAHLPQAVAQSDEAQKPFILPFKEPPGPDTWLLAQPYGNTVGAYRQRNTTYHANQGIHFGVDFSAPCGSEIVAIADGVVFAVDSMNFGSAPHNLMIDHPDLGYASFYGHLLERPEVQPGQRVEAGEVVALGGDPAETCYGRPHLHLEVRDLNHVRKYNPVLLIEADWDNLALVGSFSRTFERDLDEPRKWQHLDDQPEAVIGGPPLNDFAHPWPPDWQSGGTRVTDSVTSWSSPTPTPLPSSDVTPLPALRRLVTGGCCTQPFWSPDSRRVLFIDRPAPEAPLGIWGVEVTQPNPTPILVTERIALYTEDWTYLVDLDEETTVIERLADGARWTVPAEGRPVSFSPGRKHIAWQVSNEEALSEHRMTQVWVANLDGSNARSVATLPRGGLSGWISDDVLLLSGRESLQSREQVLYTLSLTSGHTTELVRAERLRGGLLSPDGAWLVYLIALNEDQAQNGLWLMRTDGSARRRLESELFGAYQWRDARRLLIVPFRLEGVSHELWELDVETDETRRLTNAEVTSFKIANGDWSVSPDGRHVVFVESRDRNTWLLRLGD